MLGPVVWQLVQVRAAECLEHHKKLSYQEEIREIFKRHRVAFDERYVWD